MMSSARPKRSKSVRPKTAAKLQALQSHLDTVELQLAREREHREVCHAPVDPT